DPLRARGTGDLRLRGGAVEQAGRAPRPGQGARTGGPGRGCGPPARDPRPPGRDRAEFRPARPIAPTCRSTPMGWPLPQNALVIVLAGSTPGAVVVLPGRAPPDLLGPSARVDRASRRPFPGDVLLGFAAHEFCSPSDSASWPGPGSSWPGPGSSWPALGSACPAPGSSWPALGSSWARASCSGASPAFAHAGVGLVS